MTIFKQQHHAGPRFVLDVMRLTLVPCQGLVGGDVSVKRPPLSDFTAGSPLIFNIDNAQVTKME